MAASPSSLEHYNGMAKKQVDPTPEHFDSYEAAAEFWDTHDTTDYLDEFRTVEVTSELRVRHFAVEIEEDVKRKNFYGQTKDYDYRP